MILPVTVPAGTTIGAVTDGVFIDTRWNARNNCQNAALNLTPTGIPDLAGVFIDPAFCADNGEFTIDIYEGGELLEGTVRWITDAGACYETGMLDEEGELIPAPPLNMITYGLWVSDLEERFTNEDDRVDQNLIGCNGSVRSGFSWSFLIHGFTGDGEFDVDTPESHLYPYGHNELVETITIAAEDSACFDAGPTTPACLENFIALNQALVGWDMQAFAGQAVPVTMDGTFTGGTASETQSIGLAGLDMKLSASGGDLVFHTMTDSNTLIDYTAIGVTDGGSNEIDVEQSIEVSVSSTPIAVGTTVSDVPFKLVSFTLAFMFDGPEFDAVENEVLVTATLDDGSTSSGIVRIGFDNVPTWSGSGGTITTVSLPEEDSAGVVKVGNNPFGDVTVTSVEFEPQLVTYDLDPPGYDCPTGHPNSTSCTNQSDASIYQVEIAVIERVPALAYTYDGLLESLCAVSTRTDGRPGLPICGSGGPFVDDFNLGTGLNVAGRLQVAAEAMARFVGHNICLLDAAFDDENFCSTAPLWSTYTPDP
jgi:hypothetical protein